MPDEKILIYAKEFCDVFYNDLPFGTNLETLKRYLGVYGNWLSYTDNPIITAVAEACALDKYYFLHESEAKKQIKKIKHPYKLINKEHAFFDFESDDWLYPYYVIMLMPDKRYRNEKILKQINILAETTFEQAMERYNKIKRIEDAR